MKKLNRSLYHKDIKITRKQGSRGLFYMECPKCGRIQASADEMSSLPNFTACIGAPFMFFGGAKEYSKSDNEFYLSLFN